MNKLKALMAVFMGLMMILIIQYSHVFHIESMGFLYSDVYFIRLGVETQQYTRQIEYGLKNGKSLDNFYNVDSILSDVKRCSSYINSVYIISGEYVLLYSLSDNDRPVPETVRIPENGEISAHLHDGSSYIMTVPIYGRMDSVEGYLILELSDTALSNYTAYLDRDSMVQTEVICALSFLLGTILIIHLCRRRETVLADCARVMTFSICGGAVIDAALQTVKFHIMLEDLIQQSISKIVMALQNDLNSVLEKGITTSRIYDLNSWLVKGRQGIPFISNLIFDKDYTISSIMTEDYATALTLTYIVFMAMIILSILAGLLVICLICRLLDKLNERLRLRREEKTSSLSAWQGEGMQHVS